ncbi:MAG: thermonuclease family protein [Phycisphaerae bacterium]|nr:thermonuclease family protein [Phycisphaerae bacterium]
MAPRPPADAEPPRGRWAAAWRAWRGFAYRHRRAVRTIPLLVILGVAVADHGGAFGHRGDDRQRYDGAAATVIHVASGDTLEIDRPDGGSDRTRVRLIGVEGLRGAAEFARSMLAGQRVGIALASSGPTRDADGRLLAYVYAGDDGPSFNEQLLAAGFGRSERSSKHVYGERFRRIEGDARRREVGVWGAGGDEVGARHGSARARRDRALGDEKRVESGRAGARPD